MSKMSSLKPNITAAVSKDKRAMKSKNIFLVEIMSILRENEKCWMSKILLSLGTVFLLWTITDSPLCWVSGLYWIEVYQYLLAVYIQLVGLDWMLLKHHNNQQHHRDYET